MQWGAYIFDDEGERWNANSLLLRKKLHCTHYPGDLVPDIIRNLGFVGANPTGRSCQIRLHTRTISTRALIGLIYWLAEQKFAHHTIYYLDEDRSEEAFIGVKSTLARLYEIQFNRELQRRVSCQHFDFDKLRQGSDVFALAEFWKANGGRCTRSDMLAVANHSTRGRYIHVERDDAGKFIVVNLGYGLEVPEPNWASRVIGRPVGDYGDCYYFKWVNSTYEMAWVSGRPDAAEVEATVFWPSAGSVQRHYERLLLPCVAPDGSRFLITANGRPAGENSLLKAS